MYVYVYLSHIKLRERHALLTHSLSFFIVLYNSSPLLGPSSEPSNPSDLHAQRKFSKPKAIVTRSSWCFLTPNQMKGGLFLQQFVEFHHLYFLTGALGAFGMKLVTLSGTCKGLKSLWRCGGRTHKHTQLYFHTHKHMAPDVHPSFDSCLPQLAEHRGEPPVRVAALLCCTMAPNI